MSVPSGPPSLVSFAPSDPENPYNWRRSLKWLITAQLALATWTVSFSSSAYAGGLRRTEKDLDISEEIAVLGVSLYVLGFAVGPLVFAPLSEIIGRRPVAIWTLGLYTPFHLLVAFGGNVKPLGNLQTLLACRLLTGIFGSSPLTNAGATLADIWAPKERGMAAAIYASVPFLGPIIGPIAGAYASESLGWRFSFWLMFIFGAVSLISSLFVPETYAPVLLRQRAAQLTKCSETGQVFISVYDHSSSRPEGSEKKRAAVRGFMSLIWDTFKRPFVLLISEPLLILLTLDISIVYGTLYALFEIVPSTFERSSSPSSPSSAIARTSLAFLGIGIGIIIGTISSFTWGEWMYRQAVAKLNFDAESQKTKNASLPEARLPTAITGSILLPVGLFWFAFASSSHASPAVLTLSLLPFGIGIAQLLQSTTAYLMDAYGIWFASASAAIGVFRSITGAAFPLFSTPLFVRVGEGPTMFFLGGLAVLIGLPVILSVSRYGQRLRSRSRYASKESLPEPAPSQSRPSTSSSVQSNSSTVCATEHKEHPAL